MLGLFQLSLYCTSYACMCMCVHTLTVEVNVSIPFSSFILSRNNDRYNHHGENLISYLFDQPLVISTYITSRRRVFIPGNVNSSALQFLRCTLHHLHPYNIMSALLLFSDQSKMFKTIVTALIDFPDLSSQQALLAAIEVQLVFYMHLCTYRSHHLTLWWLHWDFPVYIILEIRRVSSLSCSHRFI